MAVVKKKIVIHTEGLNRSGYWIKTDGIDLSNYEKNNVVLYEHDFGQRIGLGVNLTVEPNGDLTAEIDFNESSELGKRLKQEFEEGYIKAASIGVLPKKFSKDNQYLKVGQSMPTMIESELIEFSLVSVPNNAGAVAFKNSEEGYVKLSIQDLKFDENPVTVIGTGGGQTKHKISNMKKIAVVLGLAENASEEEILKKLMELQSSVHTLTTASAKAVNTDTLESAIIGLGKKMNIITEANKGVYERLAKVDLGLALEMVSEKIDLSAQSTEPVKQEGNKATGEDLRITAVLQALKGMGDTKPANTEPQNWDEWQSKNPKGLLEMKAKDWAKFSALYVQKYGAIPPRD